MIGDVGVEPQSTAPAIGQIEMDLLAQPTLRTNAEAVADDQHPDQRCPQSATVLHVFRASPKCNNKALAERSRFGRSGYLAGEARTKPRGGTDDGTGAARRDLRQTSSASPSGASNFAYQ